jgi:hypothetical protein
MEKFHKVSKLRHNTKLQRTYKLRFHNTTVTKPVTYTHSNQGYYMVNWMLFQLCSHECITFVGIYFVTVALTLHVCCCALMMGKRNVQ